ncbi:hypothetical protein BEE12_16050 [Pantoea agglomerans]|uniref:Acb2/Tad1 domain-containing protein n=1 Tax=Enterobacter agglomerans TaxID=549 RepID=UPI00083DC85E|nr:hypothetical protein [Pantoea agglomerans]AOE41231.1 hypothetical protein BEE12_16050 [Pantoea agglomerans]
MSSAAPQTGATVTGYRTLSTDEIALMNRFKAVSKEFCALITEAKDTGADPRWLAMAKSHMQHSCMFACRAVTKPDDDC